MSWLFRSCANPGLPGRHGAFASPPRPGVAGPATGSAASEAGREGCCRKAVPEVVNMDCNHFERLLESLERDAPMVANLRAAALQHAESCGDCRARLAAARLLRLELQALASEDEKLQAPARVKDNLLSAFREQGPRPARLGSRLSWAVVAAAAVVLAGWLLAEQ